MEEIKISQEEVIDILEKEKKPLAISEIAEKLNHLNKKRIHVIIKCLLEHEEIKCIEIPVDLSMKMYKVKRRMRLYYC